MRVSMEKKTVRSTQRKLLTFSFNCEQVSHIESVSTDEIWTYRASLECWQASVWTILYTTIYQAPPMHAVPTYTTSIAYCWNFEPNACTVMEGETDSETAPTIYAIEYGAPRRQFSIIIFLAIYIYHASSIHSLYIYIATARMHSIFIPFNSVYLHLECISL